jgi:hypothetical protein
VKLLLCLILILGLNELGGGSPLGAILVDLRLEGQLLIVLNLLAGILLLESHLLYLLLLLYFLLLESLSHQSLLLLVH